MREPRKILALILGIISIILIIKAPFEHNIIRIIYIVFVLISCYRCYKGGIYKSGLLGIFLILIYLIFDYINNTYYIENDVSGKSLFIKIILFIVFCMGMENKKIEKYISTRLKIKTTIKKL